MAYTRRSLLKSAGVTAVVASAAPFSLAVGGGNFAPAVQAAPPPRVFGAGHFGLELQGAPVGAVVAAAGGNVFADVVQFVPGDGNPPTRHLGSLHYEPITVVCPLSMEPAFWDWVGRMVAGDPVWMDGALLMADANYDVVRRVEFHHALITEVGIPGLDASSKEPGYITVVLQPEWTELGAASGELPKPGGAAKQKLWQASNFRVSVGDLPCGRVSKIDSFVIKQTVAEYRDGGQRFPQIIPGKLEFPNLVLTFHAIDRDPWQAFFDDFVLQGNNGQGSELQGALELLGPDLKSVLGRLEFDHVGIFRLAPDEVDPVGTNIQRFRADLYVERNRLFVGNLN